MRPFRYSPSAGRTRVLFSRSLLALVLGVGPLRSAPSRRLVLLAGLGFIAALVLDVFLY
jgi:hypothetical protein